MEEAIYHVLLTGKHVTFLSFIFHISINFKVFPDLLCLFKAGQSIFIANENITRQICGHCLEQKEDKPPTEMSLIPEVWVSCLALTMQVICIRVFCTVNIDKESDLLMMLAMVHFINGRELYTHQVYSNHQPISRTDETMDKVTYWPEDWPDSNLQTSRPVIT